MKVTLEKQEKNQVQLEVEVDQKQIDAAMNRVYRKLSQRVNIPGFRKGKAPRQLIERHVGTDYVKSETLDVLIPEAYSSAIEETKIEPIAQPEVEVVSFQPEEGLVFKAKVEVRPEVTLGDLSGLDVKAPEKRMVDDAALNERIDSYRQRQATLNAVDRPVQEEDTVTLDFTGYVDGNAIENGAAKDFRLEIKPGRFIPGFVEALVGMKVDETKSAELAFPEDYPQKELAGKPATFEMHVNGIEERVLPEIDDEMAKKAGFESLEAMRETLKKRLEEEVEDEYQLNLRKELIDRVLEKVEVEIPASMIDRETNFMLSQYARNLQSQGLNPNQLISPEMAEKFKEENKADAEKRIRTTLVLGAIARHENIQVEEAEVLEEITNYANSYGVPVEEMRQLLIKNGGYASIADEVLSNKIIDWLLERAKVVS